jgi:hypothetical protein
MDLSSDLAMPYGRPMHRRRAAVLAAFVALAILPLSVGPVAAADTTPPVGTIAINNGDKYVGQANVVVHVDVSDDASGVATVELSNNGTSWTDVGLDVNVVWNLPVDSNGLVLAGTPVVHARFTDGAGNVSADVTDTIIVDVTGPKATVDVASWDQATRHLRLAIAASDPAGLGQLIVVCNEGPAAFYPFATHLDLTLDSSLGDGCTGYGNYRIFVTVTDSVGNGTFTQNGVDVIADNTVEFPLPAFTGRKFTIRPVFAADIVIAPDAVCRTEFRWGSDAALFHNASDSTFGGIMFEGRAADGYCGEWTFTLPWVPRPKFDWTFSSPYGYFDKVFTATVGSTDPHIATSNIPLVYILPSSRSLTVGTPVTYTLYRLGGAGAAGVWDAHLVGSGATTGTEVAFHQEGGATFTFTPSKAGFWEAGWAIAPGAKYLLAGYYDPPAKKASTGTGGSGSSAPPAAASSTPAASPSPTIAASPSASASAGASPSPSEDGASGIPTITPAAASSPAPEGAATTSGGNSLPLLIIAFVVAGAAGGLLLRPRIRARLGRGEPPPR